VLEALELGGIVTQGGGGDKARKGACNHCRSGHASGLGWVADEHVAPQHFLLRCMFMRALLDIPYSGEGNYRCDKQRRGQQVRYTTGMPDHLLRLPKQVLIRGFDSMALAGSRKYLHI
jgi:hypothetical protein